MEFFKIVDVRTTEKAIQEKLTLGNLEEFCESIFPLDDNPEVCLTGGMWGEFTVRRDPIMGGIRFSMLNCPNALAWTITTGYPPAREKAVVHLTINRERKQEEFVEEMNLFLEDLTNGIASYFS
jgi:hypothetical protein